MTDHNGAKFFRVAFGMMLMLACSSIARADVYSAIAANDVIGLERLAKSAARPDEQVLAKSSALALRHRDEPAITLLRELADTASDSEIRAAAELSVAPVYLRQGRFGEAAAAMTRAKALRHEPFTPDELQSLDFAQILAGVEPMAVSHKASGSVPIVRDAAGLARMAVAINGQSIAAVVDSGAGFSTITETTAKKFGVRLLDRGTTVKAAAKDAVQTRLGVADRLQIGDAVLTHVVFVVLPDSALSFANGAYTIEAIVGLPVFVALERIELAKDNGKELFSFGLKPASGAPNLLLSGVEPIVMAETSAGNLRLFLDTGATHTTLNASVARDFPALVRDGVKKTALLAGAGGASEDSDAISLPRLTLSLEGKAYPLHDVTMTSKSEAARHGAIGQDLLKQGKGWSLDFAAMRFVIVE